MSKKKNALPDALKMRCMRNLETSQNSLSNLLLAADYGNVKVFYDEDDRLLGYVAWASVNKESLNLMKQSPYLPRYPYEFNEGRLMVIFDVVLSRDFAKQARTLLVSFLKEKRFFAVLKKNKLRFWSKLNSKFKVSYFSATPRFIAPKCRKKITLKNSFNAPKTIESSKISMVIPVKNNQLGINVLLDSIRANTPAANYPLEVIIVDNNSSEKVVVEGEYPFPVVLTCCETAGASAARNAGAALTRGEWLLFTDSDCIATATTIAGYLTLHNECIAYAGRVDVLGNDTLNTFYRTDKTLQPEMIHSPLGEVPLTVVTANCLILKSAFTAIGGFDQSFTFGGEDTDLGYKLKMLGQIMFNTNAAVIHDFGGGFPAFINRFLHYGKGDWHLTQHYQASPLDGRKHALMATPITKAEAHKFLTEVKLTALEFGYKAEMFSQFFKEVI